uniref:Slc16a-18 n=1 Tax=Schmidtea mediterranea TaxID=79327 RepID=A0A0H3YK72_SCHMD|nr:slc16a-18 [Schmidtea mediterranea]
MATEVSTTLHYTNYPKYDSSHIFDVTAYPTHNEESNESYAKKSEILNINGVDDLINTYQNKDPEAEDVLTELDQNEIERRQREANEETTRSEDLRQFLQEMHQKCQPNDSSVYNNAWPPGKSAVVPSSPGSVAKLTNNNGPYFTDPSPYKQMIDPYQEGDIQAMAAETAPMGPPDGGWAWLIVLASFFCMITIDGTCFNYGLLVPEMMETFQENDIMSFMWPGSLLAGFYMSMGPVASALSNQFDFRPVALAGGIISGIAILLSSFMNNLLAFIIFFGVLGGIGFSLIYLPAIAIVGHWFHEKRPIAVGLALYGSGCGTFLYGQLIPRLIEIVTWKGCIILIAAVCFQCLVFIVLFRPLELHLRMQQLSKIRSTIRQMRREEDEHKRLEHEKEIEAEKKRKKAEKEELRNNNRMKNKRIVIYRGSIMQKIIEEKKRQRTVSMGSLDGMVITRDNELIKVAKSSIDLYEKPILSMDAINRITESVVKRLENKMNKHGPNGVVSIVDSKNGGINGSSNMTNNQLKNSLSQLVQEYINSQMSLQVWNTQLINNTNANVPTSPQTLNNIQGTLSPSGKEFLVFPSPNHQSSTNISESTSTKSETSSKTSLNHGMALEEGAKAVIQASLRKEMTRPFNQKELFFTGSMRQLSNNMTETSSIPDSNRRFSLATWIDSTKRSQTSLNVINACNTSLNSQPSVGIGVNESANISILEGFIDQNQSPVSGDVYGNAYLDPNQNTVNNQNVNTDGPFRAFMRELLDVSLLTSPTFIIMVISSVASMIGIFVPFYFLPGYIKSLDMDLKIAGGLISYVGLANTAGRLFATIYIEKAWSSNYPWADCLWINNFVLILAGVTACSIPFLITYYGALVFVLCLYGLCVAGFVSLKSILVVELLGVNRLTNAFGFLLIFQGLATVIGPPLAGWICDLKFHKYEYGFYFAGSMIILSGILCFPLRFVAKLERDYIEKRYGRIVIDEENSVGTSSCVDINAENSEQIEMTNNNSGLPANKSDDYGDKTINLSENTKIDVYELNDEVSNLAPVVEEEEEDFHSDNQLDKPDLFEVKKVQ